ncbi:MOSC domain-containing protein [Knoellia flava]|uniref:Molybdenum cofactor biosysynthesis protein n=1 Tax=Knoellia flava TaxID=913969 RepID=A0A8H9FV10_9MICO|nr:MOSC domain-containing protein [Knoellia flava]GGB84261.1 molybdenum cofactor biosysynthesis protein [Knoellia flava]
MSARVLSVNVGQPMDGIIKRPTGIDKRPTDEISVADPGPKGRGGSGVEGDAVMNRKHHGGSEQAVYAFAREELDWWGVDLGRDLRAGMFGENLTTAGFDVDAAVIGEQWRLGSSVVLTVTAPRVPCATFSAHMGVRGWVKAFTARGRTGAYLSVTQPGTIRPGDEIQVLWRPGHGVTVPMAFRAWMGDREMAQAMLDDQVLPPAGHAELARKVARRTA